MSSNPHQQDTTPQHPVIIVGAGLAGSLAAIFLARRGYDVQLLEKRPDPRTDKRHEGRSINLAISERGLHALRTVQMAHAISDLCIPMVGRMIHNVAGQQQLQPYGQPGQHIHSISRRDLNIRLLNETDSYKNVTIQFDTDVVEIDLDKRRVALRTPQKKRKHWLNGEWILGADGVNSVVRKAILDKTKHSFSQDYLSYGYKELVMPATETGDYAMDPNALHIWPRKDFMLIALPNEDHSFTVTLFLSLHGEQESFDALVEPARLHAFFQKHFPDALPLLPHLTDEFYNNPIGSLVSVRCQPWHYADAAVLIGDASHAVVPFFGQGMNAAFEDCYMLDAALDALPETDLATIFSGFSTARYPHAEAIRELSLDNFIEMRSSVRDPLFQAHQKVGQLLHAVAPRMYQPLYSMISFSNIPYAVAVKRAQTQDKWLTRSVLATAGAITIGAWWMRKHRRR